MRSKKEIPPVSSHIHMHINGLERESLPRQRTPVHFKLETKHKMFSPFRFILYDEEKKRSRTIW